MKLVYIDTSVVGGVFDKEFELWTRVFFDEVKRFKFKLFVEDSTYYGSIYVDQFH